jgi:lipoprotein-releasing system permease protein
MSVHGYVSGENGRLRNWQALRPEVLATPGVAAAAPVVEMEGMIQTGRLLTGVLVNGVIPELESGLSGDHVNYLEGGPERLEAGGRGILLGRILAIDLGVGIGDGVVLLIPQPVGDGTMKPVIQRFTVRGVFEAGVQDHDARLALVHASDAARMLSLGDSVTALRFRAEEVMAAPAVSVAIGERLRERFAQNFTTSDWTIENASYFRAIRLEKMMMSLILSLIIGVAAFNIVASLVMVVTDKTSDVAILRTLGMGPNDVVRVFFIQGAAIGWIGVVLGVLGGVVLALNVPELAPALERLFGFQIMPGDVYYVTRIPSVLEGEDVAIISVLAFLLTSLATLYPARRAAGVNPSLALRYE